MRVKTYIDGKKDKDVSSSVIKINGHTTYMSKLPDPTDWRIYISRGAYHHLYSDAANALGLNETTMCYRPKERMTKREREWALRHCAVAEMITEYDKVNPSRL